MNSRCLLKFILGVVYVATLTSQQDMPYEDEPSSTTFRHHSHHHHSSSMNTTPDSYRPDTDYYESNVNDPRPPDGDLRDDGDVNRSPPSPKDEITPNPKYEDPPPQDTQYVDEPGSPPFKHHNHHHPFSDSSSDSFATNAGNPSMSRDFRPPDAPPRYDDGFNAMPPISKHHVHGTGKKAHKIDQTMEKFFHSISHVQVELKNEMRNINLRIEVVNKSVRKVMKHLLGIEVVGSILYAARILIPIVRGFFGGNVVPVVGT